MKETSNESFSRRHWLGLVSAPTIATVLAGNGAAAEVPEPTAAGKNMTGARTFNIRDYGAKGDGQTLDTTAVQAAIDACHNDHGGVVLVPAGVFAIGTVEMKSNVTLRIVAGGTLLGTADGKQYHAAEAIPLSGDSTLGDGNVGLIFAVDAENVTIEGPGTIDGQGEQFRSPTRGVAPPAGISGSHRPYHLLFHQCRHLNVRNIFLKDSAFHSVRIIQSHYVNLDAIHIHNRVNHNNDGFHFISAEHVHLSNCTVECQDDACALFGSCKFVMVTNSSFTTRWSVFRFGGGVAENITVSNCLIYETYGCPVKMRCGPGSRFENISFANIVMKDVTGPISIGNGGRMRRRPPGEQAGATNTTPPAEPASSDAPRPPGIVRNISFSGIHATVAKPVPLADVAFISNYNPGEMFSCITLNGFDDFVLQNISFNDVHVTFPGGGTAEQAAVRDVPKVAGEYYEMGVPPAYALFARNVRGLTLQNVRFQMAASDLRPAIVFDHVEDAAVNALSADADKQAESLLRFIESRDVLLSAARLLGPTPVFLQVEGAKTDGIIVDGGDLSKAGKMLAFKNGAAENAVRLRV
jgi:polygalacturonase